MRPILVVTENQGAELSDSSRELLSKALALTEAFGGEVVAVGFGEGAPETLKRSGAHRAVAVGGSAVAQYASLPYERALHQVLERIQPSLVLLPNTTLGMDLGASLAAAKGMAMVAYCCGLHTESGALVATSQVYGGKLLAEVAIPVEEGAPGTVVTVLPGSWAPEALPNREPVLETLLAEEAQGMVVRETIAPESGGDVDITRAEVLVSVGRGIQDPENIPLAEELAQVLGGVVSCSRPVVDAGWLPRSRQVGKSGLTVKPKLYLALGISGAPEHLQGMKDAELIVAVNTDPAAPIFEVAHYGTTADVLDFIPAAVEAIRERGA
ncbi:MAG: electron transfer flavoprotein subunit alpha/FixB family protein [Firmicutes bacterium]|nr:electron transfer flavoprotein subunit alpha/FixB family protein [Bacillota bacterium]